MLTRLVLDHKSTCAQPPIALQDHGDCWYPKQFDKAVVVIIDALRYDFTVPHGEFQHYLNALTVLHETATAAPENAFLLPFIADPPTATLQRLKGLTTGTLPTFVDVGSNFAGTAIEEDNLVAKLSDANKTLVHLGDDTWHSLFPGYFDSNLTRPYDSFNVWDLHTVDNGVIEHLFPILEGDAKWDVLFAHFLGVDHAGHRYGPDHTAMAAKLRQMDEVLRRVIKDLDDDTLLVVLGDHGMDSKGDHGGESDEEIEAALWMYSKKGIFGRSHPDYVLPPTNAKTRPVGQIDLVPTLALMLGLPIPFNNLGAPIEEAFIGRDGKQWDKLASAQALTASQIHNYQIEYSAARGLDQSATSTSSILWSKATAHWNESRPLIGSKSSFYHDASMAFSDYQKENLHVCRSLWARFDVPSMIMGITILALAVVSLIAYVGSSSPTREDNVPLFIKYVGSGIAVGALLGRILDFAVIDMSVIDATLLAISGTSLVGFGLALTLSRRIHLISPPKSLWTIMSILFTLSQSIGFASNSYTIWEDEILLFFLGTFAVLAFLSSLRQTDRVDRVLGLYHSALFMVLSRIGSLSRLCREEQMPHCRSTFYASATSSTSATWQLLIPYAVAIMLPGVIKGYYQGTRSYEGPAIFWIGVAVRLSLLGSAVYWTLDAADNGGWLNVDSNTLTTIKVLLAQMVLAVAFAVGVPTFVWGSPCVRIETSDGTAVETAKKVTVLGYANAHASRFALLHGVWLVAIVLVQKPMGGGAIAIMSWQLFSLLEIIDTNDLAESPVGPIVIGLLGNFYFFKTGHQAALASIQWDSAFVALKTVRYPWTPLLVMFNTFGSQLLATVFVPMVVLWKQPPKKGGLLESVTRAMATHFLYYAVICLATSMWASWLRRHLMLYRVFSPRFMTGAVVLLIVDIVGIFVAIGGFRWNMLGVAEVFGWA